MDGEPFKLDQAFTIEGWINISRFPQLIQSKGYILFRGDDLFGFDPFSLAVTRDRQVEFQICYTPEEMDHCDGNFRSSEETLQTPPQSLSANEWHHVAAVFETLIPDPLLLGMNRMRIYLDGKESNSMPVPPSHRPFTEIGVCAAATFPFVGIGNHGGTITGSHTFGPHDFPFQGLIDELTIYNKALTADQIKAIFQADANGKPPLP